MRSSPCALRERVAVKDRLFRLAAADAGQLARDLVTGRQVRRPVLLRMCLVGEAGRPAALAVERLDGGQAVTVTTAEPLAAARTAALTAEKARDALGALGGTPYRLGDLEFAVDDGVFLGVGASRTSAAERCSRWTRSGSALAAARGARTCPL